MAPIVEAFVQVRANRYAEQQKQSRKTLIGSMRTSKRLGLY